MTVTIYHNPRCSKSRQTLVLLQERGLDLEIIEYLKKPPNAKTLDMLLKKLSLEPRELTRRKEAPYSELSLDEDALDRKFLIHAMIKNPIPDVPFGGGVGLDDDFLNNVRSEMDKQGMPTITAPTLHQKQSSKTKKISSSNLKSVIKEAVKELLDETISAKLHESIGPRKSAGENFQFTVGDRVFYGKITSSKTLK